MKDSTRIPDPNGPPMPYEQEEPGMDGIERWGTFLACGSVFLFLLGSNLTTTSGATRSTRLRWQEHQRQIEDAVARESDAAREHDPRKP